jgi:putative ubiquitin-RnfH superfamily antitoxin RatB of RatAB toxin-antitoxin module
MLTITLAHSPAPRQVLLETVQVSKGSTVATALIASGWRDRFSLAQAEHLSFGIWNHPATLQTHLRDHDRVEIYRDLAVDPKVARRERFSRQGARATGLFAERRPGAKAGY